MTTIQNNLPQPNTTRQQVRQVLIVTLLLNLTVAAAKIVIGVLSGALAITADGFHSLIDATSNIVALIANKIAARPPDDDHPYGHRRYETLGALMIGAFLVLVAWETLSGAVNRLQGSHAITLTPLTFAVLVGTLTANIAISRYQMKQGKRLNSELLLADATNTRTDVVVTLSVILSMALVAHTGWMWIDAVAALIVVGFIGRAAWQILGQTGDVLVDRAPYPPEMIREALHDVPSILDVVRVRSRGPLDAADVDVDVRVVPEMTAEHTAALRRVIRDRLHDNFDGLNEIEVHFMADMSARRDYALIVRAAADALGLSTHEVKYIEAASQRLLEMHVEVSPAQTLDDAHALVSLLERNLHAQLPDINDIVTHIEPSQTDAAASTVPGRDDIVQAADNLLGDSYPDVRWHHFKLYQHAGDTTLALHAGLATSMTVEEAHKLAENAETLLRTNMPQLDRITIHTEPV